MSETRLLWEKLTRAYVLRQHTRAFAPELYEVLNARLNARRVLIERAYTRIKDLIGGDVTARIMWASHQGEIGYDEELRVDDVTVWRLDWVKTTEYVYEQRERWLVDPERFA